MRIQPRVVLWPTDFSEHALEAGRYARAVAEQFGAALHVVHVVELPITPDGTGMIPIEYPLGSYSPEFVESAKAGLARLLAEHFAGTPNLHSDVLLGNPWQGVCHYAEQKQADLLVITTHGRTGLQHLLIGSTAERIVQHSPCPVLVVKPGRRSMLVT